MATIQDRPVAVLVVRNKRLSRLYYYIMFLGSTLKADTKLYMNESLVEIELATFLQLKSDLRLAETDTKETDTEDIHIYTQTL